MSNTQTVDPQIQTEAPDADYVYTPSRAQILQPEEVDSGGEPSDVAKRLQALELPSSETEEVTQTDKTDGKLTLDQLDLPEDVGLPQSDETKAEPEVNYESEEAKKLDADLKKALGYGLKEIAEGAKAMQEMREQLHQIQQKEYRSQVLSDLGNTWGLQGADLDARIEAVKERFYKYPQEMQQKLDNIEGIKLLWAKIEQEQKLKGNVPQFQKSSGRTTGSQTKPLFTRKELDSMSPEEYARNNDRILWAYANGLVK